MDQLFEKFYDIKPEISSSAVKRMGILEFQERILRLITTKTSVHTQIRFIEIVSANIETFLIERLVEIRNYEEYKTIVVKIKHLMKMIDRLLSNLEKKYELQDLIDNKHNIPTVKYLYLTLQQSCYIEETDQEKIREHLQLVEDRNEPCILLTDSKDVQSDSQHNTVYRFICPRSFMLRDEYKKAIESKFGKLVINLEPRIDPTINIRKNLDNRENFLLRYPNINVDVVASFICEMCSDPAIVTIMVTLYRVNPKDSYIVKALKEAAKSKIVFVFVELKAHGDEQNNLRIYEELKDAGCHVRVDYLGYKVHGKFFLAMTKSGKIYAHIGTGNYNEITAQQYTDMHYITASPEITQEMLNIALSIFEKRIYITTKKEPKVFSSPVNIRSQIIQMINQEIAKGKNGLIYIKVNNLCDDEISVLLTQAAKHGVNVKIICRTACTLKPTNQLRIRSKVGMYLEHDRMYIFGDRAFIGSADLLYRNISKRFELMCEVSQFYIYDWFMGVWNSRPIFELKLNNNNERIWRRIHK